MEILNKSNPDLRRLVTNRDFKVAFFDLDGTLINSKEEIGAPTRAAIADLTQAGIQVALATGRPFFGAKWVIDQLAIRSPSLFFSGALLINPAQPVPLVERVIAQDALVECLAFARQNKIYFELYTIDSYNVERAGPLTDVHESYLGVRAEQTDLDLLISEHGILKAVLITENKEDSDLVDQFTAALKSISCAAGTGARHPGVVFHNITAESASRQIAFSELLTIYGVTAAEVIAFGDASSDIPFIELAGLGVAMGNAPVEVQSAADYVTASVDQDGIAKVVRTILG